MANRNREECFVGDGLRGRRHDMTSLRVLQISCEEKICSFVKIIIRIFLRVELHRLKFLGAENRKIVELYF
jgi:hypothetical protein